VLCMPWRFMKESRYTSLVLNPGTRRMCGHLHVNSLHPTERGKIFAADSYQTLIPGHPACMLVTILTVLTLLSVYPCLNVRQSFTHTILRKKKSSFLHLCICIFKQKILIIFFGITQFPHNYCST
jgi:hypothetical protein